MIKALLFDLDGVLRIWPPEHELRAEQATGLPPGSILSSAFSPHLLAPAIKGAVTDEYWRQQVTEHLRTHFPGVDVEQAVRLWSASSGQVDRAVLELVRACRRNVKVVLVTNATSRLALDLKQLGVAEEFDHIINSSAVCAIKPQVAIYRAALRAAKVAAKETFFVDDSPAYVAAARQLGIDGHVYRNFSRLQTALQQRGLL